MLLKHAVIEDASIELLELFDKVSVESIAEKGPANILNQFIIGGLENLLSLEEQCC